MTQEDIRQMAEACLVSRLRRVVVVGHTKKGRIIGEFHGPLPECEQAWFALLRPPHVRED